MSHSLFIVSHSPNFTLQLSSSLPAYYMLASCQSKPHLKLNILKHWKYRQKRELAPIWNISDFKLLSLNITLPTQYISTVLTNINFPWQLNKTNKTIKCFFSFNNYCWFPYLLYMGLISQDGLFLSSMSSRTPTSNILLRYF